MRNIDNPNPIRRRINLGLAGMSLGGLSPKVLAQTRSERSDAVLRVGYGSLGANRHPHNISNLPDTDIANLIWDPLLTRGTDGRVLPVLAERFEQTAPNRWRFHLRRRASFHDGRPVTAADAKFSLENFVKPETTNRYLYESWLDKVEIVDDSTFDVVSKKPYRVAIANMAYLSHVIPASATDAKAFAQRPIGSGPYRFIEFVPNDRVVLEANPAYWDSQKARFRRIVLRQIAEDSTRLAALEAGEIDFASNIPVDHVQRLTRSGLVVKTAPSNRTMFVRFNLAADGPLKEARVRRALNHAVDREALNKAMLGGAGSVAKAPISGGIVYHHGGLPPYDFSPEKARKLLAEAGFARGFEATLATPNGRYLKDREIAEAVAGQLEKVGVRLQLVPLEWANYLQQVRAERDTTGRKYHMSLMAWGNLIGDADFSLVPFDSKSTSWNLGAYANSELQALIEAGRETFDAAKLKGIYARAQELVWADAPWLFLFDLPNVNAMRKQLSGYVARADEQIRWHDVEMRT